MKGTVLVIDDEKNLCNLLSRIIGLEGYHVLQSFSAKEGLKVLAQNDVDVVISDVKLPDLNGVELVKLIKKDNPLVEVINLTAYGSIQDGVLAIKNGAFDYIVKGDDNEKIIPLVCKALEKSRLQRKVKELESRLPKRVGLNDVIGESDAIKQAIAFARKVAPTDTTVLLLGETGSGKEVFAQAIHYESQRCAGPFVAVNCSGFNKELLESELFGYKEGAFTGAVKDKKGLFDEADGGTIFLDEIGEMSQALQAKLLRVLENQTFIKIGDTKTRTVNVRVIAATNRNLQKESDDGSFRADLFYRLSVFTISLPSLSERKGDIEVLATYYLNQYAAKVNKFGFSMDPHFLEALKNHSWKGNVRELKNLIERATILADHPVISTSLLPYEFYSSTAEGQGFDLSTVEKNHIRKVLYHTGGNKMETARLLAIGLTTLYRKIEEYKL
ncbi:sigma-54-dependent transcriptional regulator [Arcticibacter eurypsychrophilus]|uniref:sigma-54-dependent transcriptional regulator n=1 Tax=Arcticibacter eurypsychrophilus TaxID=1434752 RepID=UPI001112D36D|nr:sigma-54 dependent transcriptional regulator [Arcticibacter eurypsychrophilus]